MPQRRGANIRGSPGPRGPAGPRDNFSGRGPGPGPAGPRKLHANPNLSKIHQYLAELWSVNAFSIHSCNCSFNTSRVS